MPAIKILAIFFIFTSLNLHAQNAVKSSDQTRTIEINNDNGELYISFVNSVITEFIVNGSPVAKERYEDYQEIIDDFTTDDVHEIEEPTDNEDQSNLLRTRIIDFLIDENVIASERKYNVELKSNFLKVGKEKMASLTHGQCLEIFKEIYGHGLNSTSAVRFKKTRNSSTSSVSISK